MKKTIVALAVIMLAGTASSFAQGGFQMPTPEERVKRVHGKMDSAFKLEEAKMKEVDALYLDYYKAQDKVREELMASNGGNFQGMREQMQEKMKPQMEALDAKLKPILGDDKFKIWKEQIEPTLRGRGGSSKKLKFTTYIVCLFVIPGFCLGFFIEPDILYLKLILS